MFVGIRDTELKKLYGLSGNVCAFPDCHMPLVSDNGIEPIVVLGEAAHIVAESSAGPRGTSTLTLVERNKAENLLLLCSRHHQLIDAQPARYPVQLLQQMKADHEAWVHSELGATLLIAEPPQI